jgi:hypothetical protein
MVIPCCSKSMNKSKHSACVQPTDHAESNQQEKQTNIIIMFHLIHQSLNYLINIWSFSRLELKYPANQIPRSIRYVRWDFKLAFLYFLVEILFVTASEWKRTAEQYKQQYTACPYINRWAYIISLRDDLRCHV